MASRCFRLRLTCLPGVCLGALPFHGMYVSAAALPVVSLGGAGRIWDAAFGARPDLAPAATGPGELWLRGVCLGGQGRYAAARAGLRAAAAQRPHAALASLVASTQGSLRRQLGWHAQAAHWDGVALRLVAGLSGEDARLARCEAYTGLAADALGQGRLRLAKELLERGHDQLPHQVHYWRPQVRWHWVAAELALVNNDPAQALRHAQVAAQQAAATPSIRHQLKSALVQAAAESAVGQLAQARARAQSTAAECRKYGLLPLRWAAAMLVSGLEPSAQVKAEVAYCADLLERRGGKLK